MKKSLLIGWSCVWSALAAVADGSKGSCLELAKEISPSADEISVKLVGEWDGEESSVDWGVEWYKATLTKGHDYVVWITGENEDLMLDWQADNDADVWSEFTEYFDGEVEGATNYIYYIRSQEWNEYDPPSATFFFCVSGDSPGATCKLHLQEISIAKFVPSGAELNPIALDVTSPGSRPVTTPMDGETICYYSAVLQPDVQYVFTATPTSADNSTYLNIYSWSTESVIPTGGDPTYDDATGVSQLMVSVNEKVTMVFAVEADELSDCTLAWRQVAVGDVGFAATAYSSRDDAGSAVLTVRRTTPDANVRMRWTTVAETAVAGTDYLPSSGEIFWPAGGGLTEEISIPLLPGATESRTFAVRLVAFDEWQLPEDEHSPSPSPAVAHVRIIPTGAEPPQPKMPEPVNEPASMLLADGTFEGVLSGPQAVAVSLTSASGVLTAKVMTGGKTYDFAGTDDEIAGRVTVGGETFDCYFSVALPAGQVSDLAKRPGAPALVSGSLYVQKGGETEEIFLRGPLYRVESRLEEKTLSRLRKTAGRYTLALVAENAPGVPTGHGFLTIDVAGDGTAAVAGRLGDGTDVSFVSVANDVEGGLAVPVNWTSATSSLFGILMLTAEGGALTWCDTRTQFGGDGASELRATVVARGGKYDSWTLLDRLYNDWALTVDDAESPFHGLELRVSEGRFVANDKTVELNLDRERGVLTGVRDDASFKAVLLTQVCEQDGSGAMGYADDGKGNLSALEFFFNDLDIDWSEETFGVTVMVSYNANGGTGTLPAPTSYLIGTDLILPAEPQRSADYRFVGWKNPNTGLVLAVGDRVRVPPADTVFLAQWEDLRYRNALDTDLAVSGSGWSVVTDAACTGGSALKATGTASEVNATVETTVENAGTVSFLWALDMAKLSYATGTPPSVTLTFSVDGQVVRTLSAQTAWTAVEDYEIEAAGPHTLRWTFTHGSYTASWPTVASYGSGRLDELEWIPAGPKIKVTFDPNGGTCDKESRLVAENSILKTLPTPVRAGWEFVNWLLDGNPVEAPLVVGEVDLTLTASWQGLPATLTFNGNGSTGGTVPAAISTRSGETVKIPADVPQRSGYGFLGWQDASGRLWTAGEEYFVSGSVTFRAFWEDVRLKAALDTDQVISGSGWNVAADGSAVGGSMLKSSGASVGATSTVETTVEGAGTVSFRWLLAMSSWQGATANDRFDFYVDEKRVDALSLTSATAWKDATYEIVTTGVHKLKWVHTCTTATGYAWQTPTYGYGALDTVAWEPAGERALVTFAAGGADGVPPAAEKVLLGSDWILPGTGTLAKVHHAFAGWSDGVSSYAAGAAYEVTTDMTFTATWEYVGETVTFDANGGVCDEPTRICDRGGVLGPLPAATLEGYGLVGWTNAAGVAATETTVVPAGGLVLYAKWGSVPVKVTFTSTAAATGMPGEMQGFKGSPFTLPSAAPTRPSPYVFVGWQQGGRIYSAGAETEPLEGDTVFAAVWEDPTFRNALKTDLPVTAANCAAVTTVSGATGGVCVKSSGASSGATSTVETTVEGEGTVTFRWMLAMSTVQGATANDRFDFYVDEKRVDALSLTSATAWKDATYEIVTTGVHKLKWVHTCTTVPYTWMKPTFGYGALDTVAWEPQKKDYAFVISWTANAGVVGAVYSIEGGVQNQAAVSGAEISVPDGKTIAVTGLADTNGWYYISGGEGTFSEAGSTALTAAKRSATELPNDLTPDELGLSEADGAPFADADVSELAKVVGWAQANGKSVAEMDALQFANGSSGAPLNEMAEAYLLNCAPTTEAVAAAKADFRFESFDPANPPTAADFAAKGYNGTVKVLSATAVTGPWTEGAKSGAQVFYRAILEK